MKSVFKRLGWFDAYDEAWFFFSQNMDYVAQKKTTNLNVDSIMDLLNSRKNHDTRSTFFHVKTGVIPICNTLKGFVFHAEKVSTFTFVS